MQLHERGNQEVMKKHLEQFYSTFGDRGVMFILFAFSIVLHALLSMQMELPAVQPDEIGTASIAAFYTGRDWSGIMSEIGYYYGYVQSVFYVPLILMFRSPYAIYKAMLVMNGVMISFIPLIAYHLASKLGIEKVWQKTVIALCSGYYITYIAHSKFIWNESICSLLPWFVIWCVFMAWDRSNKASKFTLSVLTGFMCGVCYAAHPRLVVVVIALALTLLIAGVLFNERILNLPAFFVVMTVTLITERFCGKIIQQQVWRGNVSNNTPETEIDRIAGFAAESGLERFFNTLCGHLYTFFSSTVGMGCMALVVFSLLCGVRIYEWYKYRKTSPESNTKVYEPIKHKFSLRLTVFGIYAFFTVGGTLLMSALFKFNSSKIDAVQDLCMFGRYTDCVAPLAIFLVLAFVFKYGCSLKQVLWATGIYCVVCFWFGKAVYPYVDSAGGYRESPVLGLLPWRMSEDYTESFSSMSFVIISSCVFAIFALLVVCTSCTRRYKTQLVSVVACGIFVYTTVFAAMCYLPMRSERNLTNTAPAKEICELIYNDKQSPTIAAYCISSRTASLVQFLNPDTEVAIVRDKSKIPDTCLLIAEKEQRIPFEDGTYDIIGYTEEHTIYAYGEIARDFIRYKRAAGGASEQRLTEV